MVKRKVNRVGSSTLTVSLPSKWARFYGLKRGDEIEVEETDQGLMIYTKKGPATPSIAHIDATGFSTLSQIRRHIGKAYRSGVETIEIKYIDKIEVHERTQRTISFKEDIERLVTSDLLGMEVEKSAPGLFVIKQFSEAIEGEFDNALRKIFYKLQDMIDQAIEALKTMKSDQLKNIWNLDRNINKFCNFCLRIINKKSKIEINSSHELYALITQLELIGDMIFMIPIYSEKMKIKKINPEIFELFNDVKICLSIASRQVFDKSEGKNTDDFYMMQRKFLEYEKKSFKKDAFYSAMLARISFIYELLQNIRYL